MGKQVLVISSSLRPNSNSELLSRQFAQGARDAGHQVEFISLRGKKLQFCSGCMACLTAPGCVIRDDANAIVEKMGGAEVICFATPVYYYEMSGQMKTLLDRANPLYSADYAFRDIYLLCAAAEEGEHTADGTVTGLQGWIDCFEKARLAGTVFAGGVTAPGEIQGHPAVRKAYDMGKNT